MTIVEQRATIFSEETAALRRDMDEAWQRWSDICQGNEVALPSSRIDRRAGKAPVERLLVA